MASSEAIDQQHFTFEVIRFNHISLRIEGE